MNENKMVEELNQLLKGSHMEVHNFQNFYDELKSNELKDVFKQILDNLHTHERMLSALLIAEQENPKQEAGIKGSLTDFMQNLKTMTMSTDKEILIAAIHAIDMASKALHTFDEQHYVLKKDMEKTLCIMQDDYRSFYHMLHKFSIEYR